MKKRFFNYQPISTDFGLLILRIIAGGAMLTHGWPKFSKMLAGNFKFGDPLGIGSTASLVLASSAEFLCSILVIIGLATRWATVPLIFTMGVAAFVVHRNDGFGTQEKAVLYLVVFTTLFFTGPGKLSLDKRF